jgi:hypothetical protein
MAKGKEIMLGGVKCRMNEIGRPSKYQESITDAEVVEYCKDIVKKKLCPTLVGLSLFLGIGVSTMTEWRKKYPSFAAVVEIVEGLQHEFLVQGGLTGDFNAAMAMFILKNKQGYRDKQDIEHSGQSTVIAIPEGMLEDKE